MIRIIILGLIYCTIFGCARKEYQRSTNYNLVGIEDLRDLLKETPYKRIGVEIINSSLRKYIFQNDTLKLYCKTSEEASVLSYTFLNDLGYRFYGPEDHWTKYPNIEEISEGMENSLKNSFKVYSLFASHGFGSKKNNSLSKSRQLWNRWRNRLRLGRNVSIEFGHYGQKFNRKYENIIRKNPDWYPRSGFKINGKLCYKHPGVISLYIEDAISRLKGKMKTSAPPYYINVEPSDGGGHCSDSVQEVSNSVFKMANEVAKAIGKVHADAYVVLMAYNKHALPPQFELEKNVLVGIIPDAFQKEMYSDDLINEWTLKHDNIFFRGYLNIPVWNKDKPENWENNLDESITKFRNLGFQGFHYEVSPSFFVNGWNFYCMSKSTYDEDLGSDDFKDFLNEFFPNEKLKQLFTDLINPELQVYVPVVIELLKEQKKQTYDRDLSLRIDDMINYAEYRKALFNYELNHSDYETQHQLLNSIVKDSYKLNIHSWGVYKSIKDMRGMPFGNYLERKQTLLSQRHSNETLVLKEQYNIGLRSSPAIPMEPSSYIEGVDKNPVSFRNTFKGSFFVDLEDTRFTVKIQATKHRASANGYICVKNNENEIIDRKRIIYSSSFHSYNFKLPDKGVYLLSLEKLDGHGKIKIPNIPFAINSNLRGFRTKKKQSYYFYSKKKVLAVKIAPNMGLFQIMNYKDKSMIFAENNHKKGKVIYVDLPEEGIYEIKTLRNNFKILSEPHFVSLSPRAIFH